MTDAFTEGRSADFLFLCVTIQVNLCSPTNNETYQERLLRLEGDKESLVLQVSALHVCLTPYQLQVIFTTNEIIVKSRMCQTIQTHRVSLLQQA